MKTFREWLNEGVSLEGLIRDIQNNYKMINFEDLENKGTYLPKFVKSAKRKSVGYYLGNATVHDNIENQHILIFKKNDIEYAVVLDEPAGNNIWYNSYIFRNGSLDSNLGDSKNGKVPSGWTLKNLEKKLQ